MKYKGMEHPPETQVWLLNLGWMVEDGVEDPWGREVKIQWSVWMLLT